MNYAKYYLGRESEYQLLTKDAVCMGTILNVNIHMRVSVPCLFGSRSVCVSAIFIPSLVFAVHNCIISAVSGPLAL